MPELVQLLISHKASLRELFVATGDLDDHSTTPPLPLPSLRDFTALRKLDLAMETWPDILRRPYDEHQNALNSWLEEVEDHSTWKNIRGKMCDWIPTLLKHLILRNTRLPALEIWDQRQLMHLLYERHRILPDLKRITLVVHDGNGLPMPSMYRWDVRPIADAVADDLQLNILTDDAYQCQHGTMFGIDWESLKRSPYCVRWKGDGYIPLPNYAKALDSVAQNSGSERSFECYPSSLDGELDC